MAPLSPPRPYPDPRGPCHLAHQWRPYLGELNALLFSEHGGPLFPPLQRAALTPPPGAPSDAPESRRAALPTPWQAGPQQHSSELGADGAGDEGTDRSGWRWPSLGTRSPGSHLKCQQQEERFDAVETTVHKVSHEEVVGLRDVATHLVGGEDSAWSQNVPHRGSPFASQAVALLSEGPPNCRPLAHTPRTKFKAATLSERGLPVGPQVLCPTVPPHLL